MHTRTNRTHRPAARGLATVVLVGAALIAPGGGTRAAAEADQTSRKLEADFEQQPASIGAPVCSPATSCVVPFSLPGVTAGGLDGTMVQAGAASRTADGSLHANSTIVFTGTVVGCGSGKVTMRSSGLNRGGVTSGSTEIIDGTGTEGLASLTGTGTVSGQVDPATGIGSGAIELKVKC